MSPHPEQAAPTTTPQSLAETPRSGGAPDGSSPASQPPPSGGGSVTQHSRRRAAEACSFCRRRKIKCNAARPVCATCHVYGVDCTYEPINEHAKQTGRQRHRAAKRRPSRPAQNQTPQRGPDGPQSPAADAADKARDGADDGTRVQTDQAGVARIMLTAEGVSSYHSRTSTLFEESVPERPVETDARPRVPEDWVERGLVAEAARQRQLETINFRQGKLDFDGVDPDLGMHLLMIHWNRQHHSFLITYRPAFMRDMASGGPYFSKLLLNAIYFGAAKFSPRLEVRKDPNDVRTAGWKFRSRVRELLGGALDCSSVTTIQALLQMTNSLFALGDERSAAWLYAGLAFRMIVDLGMHVDLTHTGRFSDEDLEIRRRVFWGAFVVDKMQSLYQGRPVTLKDSDAIVPLKFLDTFEELESWQPFAYSPQTLVCSESPAYSVSTFTALCRLSLAMSDILGCIYTERSVDLTTNDLASTLERLQWKLDQWATSLPSHLQLNPTKSQGLAALPPPHVFSLHAMHNVLIILLHRPFVADGHLYNTSRSVSRESLMKCVFAASAICSNLRLYDRAFSIRRAPYLISYATYVAATILVRIAAKRRDDARACAELATCLAVFKGNQETNFAVKKASMVIEALMKRLKVDIDPALTETLTGATSSSTPASESLRQAGANPPSTAPERPPGEAPFGSSGGLASVLLPAGATSTPPNTVANSLNAEMADIDGIIQSFLQEEHASGSNTAGNNYRTHWPQEEQAGLGAESRAQLSEAGPAANFVGPAEAVYVEQPSWSQGWQQGFHAEPASSIDDLLFGFNSTFPFAVDGMSYP